MSVVLLVFSLFAPNNAELATSINPEGELRVLTTTCTADGTCTTIYDGADCVMMQQEGEGGETWWDDFGEDC